MVRHIMVPPEKLREDPGQPRKSRDTVKQQQLVDSVALHGILQPIGVRHDLVTVVWGWGRALAAVAAGLKHIPAVAMDEGMAEWQYHNLALVENVVRSDITQFELWRGCVKLQEANPTWGMKELAKALSYDASMMTRIMSPSRVIPQAQEAFKAGTIVFGHTYAISKAESPEDQESVLNLCLAGASRDAAEKAVRTANIRKNADAGGPVSTASRIKCQVPGKGATVQIVCESETTLEGMIEAAQDWVKLAKRESDKGLDAKTLERVCRDLAKKA